MEHQPFVIERTYNTSLAVLWKAISNKEDMKKWYFDLVEFKPEVGFEFKFLAGEKGKEYMHICKVFEVIKNRKLAYSWRYEGYEGNSMVTFELFDEGNKTRLRLTHSGLESFPASNPDLAKKNFVNGWNDLIGNILKDYVEKMPNS